jgi:hypothetical protein
MANPPNTDNIFGATSNVNLTDIVKLNENPLDIPKSLYLTLSSWNAFQKYLEKNNLVRKPEFNKNQEDTNKNIEEYNNSITNPNFQKITQDAIVAAQTFHKKSDPKVQIDGWVGSQTSQLKYPSAVLMYERAKDQDIPADPKGFLPIIWGNKRFVISAEIQTTYNKKKLFAPLSSWIQYDENIHVDLQTNYIQNSWYTLNQETKITKSASEIESQRKIEKINSQKLKAITNIKLAINSQK